MVVLTVCKEGKTGSPHTTLAAGGQPGTPPTLTHRSLAAKNPLFIMVPHTAVKAGDTKMSSVLQDQTNN